MSEIVDKREEVLKEVSSIIASAPRGLTAKQVESDYYCMIGKRLPLRELGFHNVEEFFRSVPESISMRWENGDQILRAIPNEKTARVISLIQRNKVSKKKMRTTIGPRSTGYYRPRSTGYYRPNYDRNYARPRRYDNYDFQPSRVVRTQTPSVSPMLRGEIRDFLVSHPTGVHIGANFDMLFKEKFGHTVNFSRLGYPSMLAMFKSMEDIVQIEELASGGHKVRLCLSVGNRAGMIVHYNVTLNTRILGTILHN